MMQTWDLHHANLEFTDFTMFERPNANMGPPTSNTYRQCRRSVVLCLPYCLLHRVVIEKDLHLEDDGTI